MVDQNKWSRLQEVGVLVYGSCMNKRFHSEWSPTPTGWCVGDIVVNIFVKRLPDT